MPARILHIIPTLDRSGAEKQLVLLAAGLPRDEFDVHVCTLTRGGPLEADLRQAGVPLHPIGKRFKFDPFAWRRLYRLIRELRPDVVQTWLFAANSYGRLAAVRAGVPHVIGGERSVDPWKRPHELMLDRWLAKRSERIVVNSTGVRDFYVAHGLPASKFVMIANGVHVAAPSPADRAQARADLLAELGLPSESRFVGAIGRLWPQKRVDDLIWALDLLKAIRPEAHLLIIGDGPRREALERFCYKLDLNANVHFLGRRDDVSRLLGALDLLWLGSEYEGLPNVVMEAMAAGLPVVASDIAGSRDLVISGETGYLARIGDRASFAKYADRVIGDPNLAARLGAAGQKRMQEHFSVKTMIDRYIALYRQLLAPHASPLSPQP